MPPAPSGRSEGAWPFEAFVAGDAGFAFVFVFVPRRAPSGVDPPPAS
ncbi:hypothetical protein BISA_2356, partial [Bifidobacterium saguini DSM 23967]